MDLTIRQARAQEYEALGAVVARAYRADGLLDFEESDGYEEQLRDVAGRAAAARILVAVDGGTDGRAGEDGTGGRAGDGGTGGRAGDGGRVLGGVTFVESGGPMAELARAGEAEIRMLAVAPDARGRGAGEALVRACVERARAVEGCVRVILSTQPTMHAAHRLYERLGFVRVPERDWLPVPDVRLLAYELELRARSGP
ncbi:GNAT family N-acetyltransferase [Streptomyces sp. NPDC059009]|uniref:GNAT family N-acetyltransferase n=1 Tax=Streptomyces sp. NPDC059009 TaxID=3346694 RepID=UPI0036A0035A